MKIDEAQDPDYEVVNITNVGLVDQYGTEGGLTLSSVDGKEFHMSAFSGEVAQHIANFRNQNRDTIPTIYNMVEQLCEENGLFLVKVKVYNTKNILRSNLYFTGAKDVVLKNYRASDAIALATFYNVPILIRKDLLRNKEEMQ